MRAAVLPLAAVLLLAVHLASAQVQFYSMFHFPTTFGAPSCIAYNEATNTIYAVGSSSVRLLLDSLLC